jgi:hypothetical protein
LVDLGLATALWKRSTSIARRTVSACTPSAVAIVPTFQCSA